MRKNTNQHIYITSNAKITKGDYWYDYLLETVNKGNLVGIQRSKKIILTTDQDLIKEGVQAIDDEFLEWFVNNPSCEEVEVSYEVLNPFQSENKGYLIHCPDNEVLEEPKQEQKQHLIDMMQGDEDLGLYDDSTRYAHNNFNMHETNNYQALKQGYEAGATEMANKMYTEKDLRDAYNHGMFAVTSGRNFNDWFKQLKKK